jgi:hypothetical protein
MKTSFVRQTPAQGNYFAKVVFLVGFIAVNPLGQGHATAVPSCAPAPSDLVSWWRAEGNTLDSVDGNNGSAIGTIGYANGEVGQAFLFDGSSYLAVPASTRMTFQSPALPCPVTALRKPGGDRSSSISLKSNLISAAAARHDNAARLSQTKCFVIRAQLNKRRNQATSPRRPALCGQTHRGVQSNARCVACSNLLRCGKTPLTLQRCVGRKVARGNAWVEFRGSMERDFAVETVGVRAPPQVSAVARFISPFWACNLKSSHLRCDITGRSAFMTN